MVRGTEELDQALQLKKRVQLKMIFGIQRLM